MNFVPDQIFISIDSITLNNNNTVLSPNPVFEENTSFAACAAELYKICICQSGNFSIDLLVFSHPFTTHIVVAFSTKFDRRLPSKTASPLSRNRRIMLYTSYFFIPHLQLQIAKIFSIIAAIRSVCNIRQQLKPLRAESKREMFVIVRGNRGS